MLPKLYYISQGNSISDHEFNIMNALEGGVKMIQIRLKELHATVSLSWYEKMIRVCREYDAICIINDYDDVAIRLNADGVHVGKEDTLPSLIRKKSGNKNLIIGATANNKDDLIRCMQEPVDYIGFGPLRYTPTKKKLAEPLGINGIKIILRNLKSPVPVYAIGGIKTEDVESLMDAGCYGVAVSTDLTEGGLNEIKKKIEQYNTLLYA
ncbi:MAG: thiamine phosphate synthase [Bacteroidia bacterium]|nr:thiamine phosphate synthase [Bacteroidia bacterium]